MHLKYAEYFLGIGAPGKAIHRVTARHGDTAEFVYGFEIDKYARNAFAAIHRVDEDKIYHDVTDQPEELPYVDIIFYSPPCQTFSPAGNQQGTTVEKGNLFYHALEGIKKSKPKYAIMENVSNLAQQFKDDFKNMLAALEDAGYINYNKILNSKNFGIPQNRERIFIVSIRKDVYESGERFEFPEEIKLEKCLKDLIEPSVPDKYFISQKLIDGSLAKQERRSDLGFHFEPTHGEGVAKCLTARYHKSGASDTYLKVEQVGNLNPEGSFDGNPQVGRVYSPKGLAPTLSTCGGGGQEPKILVKSATVGGVRRSLPRRQHQHRTPQQQDEKGESG